MGTLRVTWYDQEKDVRDYTSVPHVIYQVDIDEEIFDNALFPSQVINHDLLLLGRKITPDIMKLKQLKDGP